MDINGHTAELEYTFSQEGYFSRHFRSKGGEFQTRQGQLDLATKILTAQTTSTHMMGEGPTGCHAKGQGILMFNGLIKKVEDIEVGDLLMGPDSTPREVLRLVRGTGDLVSINPNVGNSWIVNIDHILTFCNDITDLICDVSVREFLEWHPMIQDCAKLFKSKEGKIFDTTRFSVEAIGTGDYYGFTLDKDGRYLLDDFTVTHNCGKSFAYSVPSIQLIKDKDLPHIQRLIIATANIALQEQLFYKDLPILKEAVFPDLTFGLLKGKNNYLCQQKYNEAQDKLFQDADLNILEPWFKETQTGDKSELETPIKRWHLFSSTSQECLGKKCPYKDHCFARVAQNKARNSEVIVTNFHMLLVAGGGLPAHQLLVCDEGHELPSVARSALGFTISRGNLDWMKAQFDKMGKQKDAQILEDAMLQFENHFFSFIGTGKKSHRRIEAPQEVPDLSSILGPLGDLKRALRAERDAFKEEGNEVEEAKCERDAKRVHDLIQNFDILQECDPTYVFWAEKKRRKNAASSEDKTWKTKGKKKRRANEWINIECRPIDVSEMLQKLFFVPKEKEVEKKEGPKVTVFDAEGVPLEGDTFDDFASSTTTEAQPLHYSTLLISATMTTNDGFGFIREETGLTPQLGIELSVPSPFNLQEQGTLIVPETMAPQPKWGGGPQDQEYYYEALADHLQEFVNRCDGRVLALFTSWTALSKTIEKASPDISVPILSQGEGGRTQLVARFRAMEEGLLAGVSSFWTGVDIPGMQGLFIDKLPFPVPSDPLFAAMSDLYETRGKRPFFDLSLPLATLKLRQGIGRLIRTVNDRGYAMLADRRLLDKGYGSQVIRALPDFRFIVNVDKM